MANLFDRLKQQTDSLKSAGGDTSSLDNFISNYETRAQQAEQELRARQEAARR